jgi:acyl-CoA synthetase (AMP-forming)/AMP-acid ligase II
MFGNVASHLTRMAMDRPEALALVCHDRRGSKARLTYRELDEQSSVLALGLHAMGIERGHRAVLMVPPSLDLFRLVFAFFKAGVIPVMVDPGMGTASLATCLSRAAPTAFVGVAKAHAARIALGWAKDTLKTKILVSESYGLSAAFGAYPLSEVRWRGAGKIDPEAIGSEDTAAILFTSGSTGIPKGAVYQHRNFLAQVEAIRDLYDIRPGEVDLPTFPLFALFDPALGMTTVIPDMDATRPASVDPVRLAAAISEFSCTNLFGSPALLDTVSRWAAPRGHVFTTLSRVISAGAPVAPKILERMARCLPKGARIHTPYGATESLPIASIDHLEVLGETGAMMAEGKGICVGKPVPSVRLRILKVSDGPIEAWDPALSVREKEIGEITVSGPQVTSGYFAQDDETKKHKLTIEGALFHRTGDVGYLDAAGRLWYCGRKSQRVRQKSGDLYTEVLEGPFNAHPEVRRSALVGAWHRGELRTVICIEPDDATLGAAQRRKLEEDLINLVHDRRLPIDRVLVARQPFPVDVRHNAKIGREKLAIWAERELAAR